jgi:hypothetical protein
MRWLAASAWPPSGAMPPDKLGWRVRLRLHPLRRPGPRRPRLSADHARNGVPGSRREHPLAHTSILKTVQQRWSLPSLTARDAAPPSFADLLSLATPSTDDVLAGAVAQHERRLRKLHPLPRPAARVRTRASPPGIGQLPWPKDSSRKAARRRVGRADVTAKKAGGFAKAALDETRMREAWKASAALTGLPAS